MDDRKRRRRAAGAKAIETKIYVWGPDELRRAKLHRDWSIENKGRPSTAGASAA